MMFQLLVTLSLGVVSFAARPGPSVIASKGEVWPLPQQVETSTEYFILLPHTFNFKPPADVGCPGFLNSALNRYWAIISETYSLARSEPPQAPTDDWIGYLDKLDIELEGECPNDAVRPDFGEVENYTLTISASEKKLSAPSIWGILRGLETFSQLVYVVEDRLVINSTTIVDYPRFPHRGLLVDTSRHFIPLHLLLTNLDAMAYNKFNIFHWHISDDQSFPYQSSTFPELSDLGAYHPVAKVYTKYDVQNVIEYARLRGIRVIPEFDTPGHTSSWGVSHPEVLTACYKNGEPTGELGPLDPSKDTTYDFLRKLFTEIVEVFPDSYFHIGGDEVPFDCWQSNPDITAFMAANNLTDYSQLETYFIQKVLDIMNELQSSYLVWEEVFVNGVTLPNDTHVHVWRGEGFDTLRDVTTAGKFGVFSSCWYLDHLSSGGDWTKFYECEPFTDLVTDDQKNLVLGGEACMWAESVNQHNILPRIWPRASAAAEKLWSNEAVKDTNAAKPRLEEHTCRMNTRKIPAQPPNGPGVCL